MEINGAQHGNTFSIEPEIEKKAETRAKKVDKIIPKKPVKRNSSRPGSVAPSTKKHGRRESQASRMSIVGKPSGLELEKVAKKPSATIELSPAKKAQIVDQDATPPFKTDLGPEETRIFEERDEEGKRYLHYKKISGMDTMPRIRQPTPPHKKKLEDLPAEGDCNKCSIYRAKCRDLLEENMSLKEDLEKVHAQLT